MAKWVSSLERWKDILQLEKKQDNNNNNNNYIIDPPHADIDNNNNKDNNIKLIKLGIDIMFVMLDILPRQLKIVIIIIHNNNKLWPNKASLGSTFCMVWSLNMSLPFKIKFYPIHHLSFLLTRTWRPKQCMFLRKEDTKFEIYLALQMQCFDSSFFLSSLLKSSNTFHCTPLMVNHTITSPSFSTEHGPYAGVGFFRD